MLRKEGQSEWIGIDIKILILTLKALYLIIYYKKYERKVRSALSLR